MAARVAWALNREMDGRGSPREGHRHRIPLGLVLLEQGWITNQDLRAALQLQKDAGGGRLGRWLVESRSASQENVTRALGLQWGCPVLAMEFHHPEGLTALVPRLFVDAFGALPLRVAAGRILYLGFEDHLDAALALALERMTGLEVVGGLVQEPAFRPAHSRLLEARFPGGGTDRSGNRIGAGLGFFESHRTNPARGVAPGAGARLLLAAYVDPARQRAVARDRIDSRSYRLRRLSLAVADSTSRFALKDRNRAPIETGVEGAWA